MQRIHTLISRVIWTFSVYSVSVRDDRLWTLQQRILSFSMTDTSALRHKLYKGYSLRTEHDQKTWQLSSASSCNAKPIGSRSEWLDRFLEKATYCLKLSVETKVSCPLLTKLKRNQRFLAWFSSWCLTGPDLKQPSCFVTDTAKRTSATEARTPTNGRRRWQLLTSFSNIACIARPVQCLRRVRCLSKNDFRRKICGLHLSDVAWPVF